MFSSYRGHPPAQTPQQIETQENVCGCWKAWHVSTFSSTHIIPSRFGSLSLLHNHFFHGIHLQLFSYPTYWQVKPLSTRRNFLKNPNINKQIRTRKPPCPTQRQRWLWASWRCTVSRCNRATLSLLLISRLPPSNFWALGVPFVQPSHYYFYCSLSLFANKKEARQNGPRRVKRGCVSQMPKRLWPYIGRRDASGFICLGWMKYKTCKLNRKMNHLNNKDK